MSFLSINTWFVTLIKQFFFNLDQVVFNFISEVYDLLITISRTSIITQADIKDISGKIYALLTVFMVFKVTLSLITYVVNPDDFTDKSKGISKLGTNIIISLSLLVLTPYIFNYAFELQTFILEDNALAKLFFETGENTNNSFTINTAGDDIAFYSMSAFFKPNVSISKIRECIDLFEHGTGDEIVTNFSCTGVSNENGVYEIKIDANNGNTMANLTKDNDKFDPDDLINYVVGLENKSLGLMFRQDLAVARYDDQWVMDYKYIFSTIIGVVIILLLITYCMDVAIRSIKLGFLQLIAPIPILSYVDPKSGKDGMFKKWYQMCFKTYLSLFIRLLALYFAIYIIGRVGKMVDIVDGSYVTNAYIKIFIIIGALMFAKQLPKMLEGLGIKLDGDGKFTLNPLKKFEEGALGGKNITGMARGALMGTVGALTGAGATAGLTGAFRGLTAGKGWKETGKMQADMNRKMRQAKLDGSTFGGRLGARFAGAVGMQTRSERIEGDIHSIDEQIKTHQNATKALELERDDKKTISKERVRTAQMMTKSMGDAKNTFIEKMKDGVGNVGSQYLAAVDARDAISAKLGQVVTFKDSSGSVVTREVTQDDISAANSKVRDLEQNGWKTLIDEQIANSNLDAKLQTKLDVVYQDYATANNVSLEDAKREINSGKKLNSTLGTQAGVVGRAEAEQRRIDEEYYEQIKSHNDEVSRLEEEKRQRYEEQRIAKADENAIK